MATSDGAGGVGNVRLRRPVWRPAWEPHKAWAMGFVSRNLWRVRRLYEFDDAVQECGVVFVRCRDAYEGKVTDPALFMALYKTAVTNKFHDFAVRNSRSSEAESAVAEANGQCLVEYSDGPLFTALSRASDELREVCRVVANAPAGFLVLLLDGVRLHRSKRDEAALSRALCRLARVNVRSDLLVELRTILAD